MVKSDFILKNFVLIFVSGAFVRNAQKKMGRAHRRCLIIKSDNKKASIELLMPSWCAALVLPKAGVLTSHLLYSIFIPVTIPTPTYLLYSTLTLSTLSSLLYLTLASLRFSSAAFSNDVSWRV